MKQKDLSEDVELLSWAKYLSESDNLSLRYLAFCLQVNIYEDLDKQDFEQIKAEDIPQSDWIKAAPLAHCLLQSSNPVLEFAAEHFFKALESVTLEMTEIRITWNSSTSMDSVRKDLAYWKHGDEYAPF
jgi:hypothetical protein